METMPRPARLAVGSILILSLAACSAGATKAPSSSPGAALVSPSATLSPSPSPSPAQRPLPSPISYGPVAVIESTNECSFGTPETTTDAKGVDHARASVECTVTANDPRASGTYKGTWYAERWNAADNIGFAMVQWEVGTTTNTGGAWECRSSGVYSTDRGDILAGWCTGTGGYAGLSSFLLTTGNGPWITQGQIVPGSPPPP